MKHFNVLVDWGESFVDSNGNFYCGTTTEQKEKAGKILKAADTVLEFNDVHTSASTEFLINGGFYPVHNLIKKDWNKAKELQVPEGKTVSPQLTDALKKYVRTKEGVLFVPRDVYFQDYNGGRDAKPAFSFEDVQDTFLLPKMQAYDPSLEYIVSAKHMFNAAGMQATMHLGNFENIPDEDGNIFTAIKSYYGQGENISFDITGVVMGICIYQTAGGIRQLFPKAKINVIADACTHLIYKPLGIETEEQGNLVAKAMCTQIGVNYISTKESLGE